MAPPAGLLAPAVERARRGRLTAARGGREVRAGALTAATGAAAEGTAPEGADAAAGATGAAADVAATATGEDGAVFPCEDPAPEEVSPPPDPPRGRGRPLPSRLAGRGRPFRFVGTDSPVPAPSGSDPAAGCAAGTAVVPCPSPSTSWAAPRLRAAWRSRLSAGVALSAVGRAGGEGGGAIAVAGGGLAVTLGGDACFCAACSWWDLARAADTNSHPSAPAQASTPAAPSAARRRVARLFLGCRLAMRAISGPAISSPRRRARARMRAPPRAR